MRVVDFKEGTVTIESDLVDSAGKDFTPAFEELRSAAARHLAREHAVSCGLANPGCGSTVLPYPVGEDGQPLADSEPLGPHCRYRIDIPITASLG